MTLPVAVLVSGRGSNLQAILDACASGDLDARVAIVVSNHAGVPALQRAALAGVPSAVFTLRTYSDRGAAHSAMAAAIAGVGAELVVLAGFDHILAPIFFVRLSGVPVINLHPACARVGRDGIGMHCSSSSPGDRRPRRGRGPASRADRTRRYGGNARGACAR